MTLIEVVVAITLFALTATGIVMGYGVLNKNAARLRCDAAASAILRAKVGKLLTDQWIPQSVPLDCVVTSGEQPETADPKDPYDVGATVTLLSQSDSPLVGFVTGNLYRTTSAFEAAANTVVVDYRLSYVFRGITYNSYTSTIRARDK